MITYSIDPTRFETVKELPNAWSNEKYKQLLEEMDVDGASEIPQQELKEMCHMALTDNEPEDAAKIVLKFVFGERLTPGQIDNISVEMLHEKMWEEYPDLSLHEGFFNSNQLLRDAFNGTFPKTEAISFQINVSTKNKDDLSIFGVAPETSVIRLLIQGMPESTLINRLFDDKLTEGPFDEAKDIIWQINQQEINGNTIQFDLISSKYWFHDFEEVNAFEGGLNHEE